VYKVYLQFTGLPSDILPAMRPELQSVDNVSADNSADASELAAEGNSLDRDVDTQSVIDDGVLVGDEERRSGVVRLSIYWSYFMAVGRCLATLVLLSILLMQGLMFIVSVIYSNAKTKHYDYHYII